MAFFHIFKKIYQAKGRASDNPLIAHISNYEMLENLVVEVGEIEKVMSQLKCLLLYDIILNHFIFRYHNTNAQRKQ